MLRMRIFFSFKQGNDLKRELDTILKMTLYHLLLSVIITIIDATEGHIRRAEHKTKFVENIMFIDRRNIRSNDIRVLSTKTIRL